MFGGTFISGRRPIGLEMGDGVIRMIQLARSAGGLRVVAARRRMLPVRLDPASSDYGAAVREAISEMLQEGPFIGRRVVSCLPSSMVHYKNLRLPPMPPAELAEAVRWEAAERLQELGSSLMTQYFDAGEVRQGEEVRREVIAIAVDEKQVDRHVQLMVDCGLRPACVEVAASALARLTGPAAEDGQDVTVLLNPRTTSTEVLIARGRHVLFCKSIGLGIAQVDQAIADGMGLELDAATKLRCSLDDAGSDHKQIQAAREALTPVLEELGREIGLCLRYFGVTFRGARPETAVLVGALAGQAWLIEPLTQSIGVSVQTWDLAGRLHLTDGAVLGDEGSGAWAVALGLALRQGKARVSSGGERKDAA